MASDIPCHHRHLGCPAVNRRRRNRQSRHRPGHRMRVLRILRMQLSGLVSRCPRGGSGGVVGIHIVVVVGGFGRCESSQCHTMRETREVATWFNGWLPRDSRANSGAWTREP